jgi:nucleoside phosphorylase
MPSTSKYEETPASKIRGLRGQINVLLVTVTRIETAALHNLLKPLPESKKILRISKSALTYHVGVLGNYRVCHVACKMGSVAAAGSLATTRQAIEDWTPKAIIMVGIAFGKDEEEQRIGDVLLSEHVLQYQSEKVTRMGDRQNRGSKPHCGATLLNIFESYHDDWQYSITESASSTVLSGDLLSGEQLIDNKEHRDELLQRFPTAIGGEMEGIGLANAAGAKHKEWLVVKGICDFADGNKGEDKTHRQQLAAGAAASLCEHIFNNRYVFEELRISALLEPPTQVDIEEPEINKDVKLAEVEFPEIPGLTDSSMQADDKDKLTRAFFGQTLINRFRIGIKLGLIDVEETKKPNQDAVSAQILIRAQQQQLFAKLWALLFDEKKEPNPFK